MKRTRLSHQSPRDQEADEEADAGEESEEAVDVWRRVWHV